MWKAVVILGLAVAALALPVDHEKTSHEQIIRIGAVGLSFADVMGHFVPKTPETARGVPAYEFKSTVDGAPVTETDFISFRCNHVSDFFVAPNEPNAPLLICSSIAFEKEDAPAAEKTYFLFSAHDLPVTSELNKVHLSFGKNAWKSIVASHPGANHAGSGVHKTLDIMMGFRSTLTLKGAPFFDDLAIIRKPENIGPGLYMGFGSF